MKISGTIPKEQLDWMEEKIKTGRFYNTSHILQEGIKALIKKDENKG